ncbi:MAG TPA: hypothetical protein VGQ91_02080 [Ideonella sp.]|jgi:hypothetical protein|nr:hypothetical protein [Ideonella sp.]
MAERQQRGNKEAKKPKKDSGSSKAPIAATSDRPVPPMTAVLPKGKLKNKAP